MLLVPDLEARGVPRPWSAPGFRSALMDNEVKETVTMDTRVAPAGVDQPLKGSLFRPGRQSAWRLELPGLSGGDRSGFYS